MAAASFIFTFIALIIPPSFQSTASGWTAVLINDLAANSIRSSGMTFQNNPIKIDNHGNVHIVYNKEWQIYDIFNNSGYFNETAFPGIRGSSPSFDIDSEGKIHLSYYIQSETGYADIYYYKEGDSSSIKITSGDGVYFNPSIAVDSNGYVHIAFMETVEQGDNKYFRILYTDNVGGTFKTPVELNYTNYINFGHPSIVVDANGVSHIVCYSRDNSGVYIVYANYSSGVLSQPIKVNSTLVSANISAPIPDLTVDGNNNIHIVFSAADLDHYSNGNPNFNYTAVYYVNYSNGVFSTPIKVSGNVEITSHPSIALDTNGVIHIVFAGHPRTELLDYDIFYVDNSTGSFSSPLKIFDTEHTDYLPHIEVDSHGFSHIVFYETLNDLSASKLYYLTNSPYPPHEINRGMPVWLWIVIGVAIGAGVIGLAIFGWKKYKQLEKELEKEIRKK